MAKYLIAVDSGHGMQTAGKRTPAIPEAWFNKKKGDIIHEKEFNKPAAEYLITALKRCGFDTINVSPGTADVSLKDRYTKANNTKANAFVSSLTSVCRRTRYLFALVTKLDKIKLTVSFSQ